MRGRVRELIRPSNIPCGVNVGVNGLQISVGLYGALRRDAQGFKSVTIQACDPTDGANELIKSNGAIT